MDYEGQEIDLTQPIDDQSSYVRHLLKQIHGYDEWRKVADDRLERVLGTSWVKDNPEAQAQARRSWGGGGSAAQFYEWLSAKRGERKANALFRRAGVAIEDREVVDSIHADPTAPPGARWTPNRGAMPGEPVAYLDGDAETSQAAIIEREQDDGGVLYEAVGAGGATIGTFSTIGEAAAAAEAAVLPQIPDAGNMLFIADLIERAKRMGRDDLVAVLEEHRLAIQEVATEGKTERESLWGDEFDDVVIEIMGAGIIVSEPGAAYARVDTNSAAFKAWFKDSVVVDSRGNPLVLLHGTDEDFTAFKLLEGLAFFSTDPEAARWFAGDRHGRDPSEGNIVEVFLRIENPLDMASLQEIAAAVGFNPNHPRWQEGTQDGETLSPDALSVDFVREEAIRRGFDGWIGEAGFLNRTITEYVIFDAKQVKSAVSNRGTFDPTDPNILREGGAAYLGDTSTQDAKAINWTPETDKSGKFLGAPENVETMDDFLGMLDTIRDLAKEGAVGRYWYEDSARAILAMVNGDVGLAAKFAGLIAIYSAHANVEANTLAAVRVFNQWMSGVLRRKIHAATKPQDTKARWLLFDDVLWDGHKTSSFYLNLMHHIQVLVPPSEFAKLNLSSDLLDKISHAVTVDLWIYRALGYKVHAAAGDLGSGKYTFSEKSIQRITAELNEGLDVGEQWLPHQVQAAIWTAIKARFEIKAVKDATNEESAAAGFSTFIESKETGKRQWSAPTNINDKREHDFVWRSNAMLATKKEVAAALAGAVKSSFADYILAMTHRVTWEAIPGPSLGHEITSASPELRAAFTQEARALIIDENGIDLLAALMGLKLAWNQPGSGGYRGDINVNTLSSLVPSKLMKPGAKRIDFTVEQIQLYARMIQLIYRQEAVPYFRADLGAKFDKQFAVHKKPKKGLLGKIKGLARATKRFDSYPEAQAWLEGRDDADQYEIRGGKYSHGALFAFKSLNEKGKERFYALLRKYLPADTGFSTLSSRELAVINFSDDETNIPFADDAVFVKALLALEADHGKSLGIESTIKFGSEGKYGPVENWGTDQTAADRLDAGRTAGSPDLLEWVHTRISAYGALLERYTGEQLLERERELREAEEVSRPPARGRDIRRTSRERLLEEIKHGAIIAEPTGVISDEEAQARAEGAAVQLSLFGDDLSTVSGEVGQPGMPGAQGARLLAKQVPAIMEGQGYIDLTGQPARNPQELAYIARIFRDKRFETTRVFWIKDGVIIAHEAVSSRMPGMSSIHVSSQSHEKSFYEMARRARRLGADGYYLMHNHPSGQVLPSDSDMASTGNQVIQFLHHSLVAMRADPETTFAQHADIDLVIGGVGQTKDIDAKTQRRRIGNAMDGNRTNMGKALIRLQKGIPSFNGHIILDHDEYGLIQVKGAALTHEAPDLGRFMGTVDPLLANPEVPSDVLGKVINDASPIAKLGAQLMGASGAKPGHAILFHLNSQNLIVAAEEVPDAIYRDVDKLREHIIGRRPVYGSARTVAYFTDHTLREVTARHARAGTLLDAVYDDGYSKTTFYDSAGAPKALNPIPARTVRVMDSAADDAEYNAGLRALALQDELTSEEADEYAALRLELAHRKRAELRQTYLEQQKERASERYGKEVERIKEEVAGEMAEQPHWAAARYFQKGQVEGHETLPAEMVDPEGKPWKMSKDELVERYGPDILFDLRTGSGGKLRSVGKTRTAPFSDTGTTDLDGLALIFGFSGADEMVETLAASERYDDAYKARVKTRVDGELGNIEDPDQLAQAALDGAAGPEAVDQILVDLRFLNRILTRRGDERRQPVSKADLRDKAKTEISRTRAGLILPYVHERTASKHGRLAFEASERQDFATAYTERLRQIWQLALFRAAKHGVDRIGKVRRLVKRLSRPAAQKILGKAGTDYLMQANELLQRYDMRDVTNKAIKANTLPIEGETLDDWAERLELEEGRTVVTDERLLTDAARKKTWKELTLSELEGLSDTLKSIAHNAYTTAHLIREGEAVEWEEIIGELESAVINYGPVLPGVSEVDPILREGGAARKVGIIGKSFVDANIKVEEFVRRLDKDDVRGPWNTHLFEGVSQAQGLKADMMMKYAVRLREAFEALPAKYRKRLFKDKTLIPSLGVSFTRSSMLMVALNTGTDGNWQRLDEGRRRSAPKWGPIAVREILAELTREDWEFVIEIWDIFRSLGDLTDELERRDTGIPLKRVKLTPRTQDLGDGTTIDLPGGYIPIMYDPTESLVAKKQLTDDTTGKALTYSSRVSTSRGRTKERVKEFHDALFFHMDLLPGKILEAIHDVSHREVVRQIDRILRDPSIHHAMMSRMGQSGYEQFTTWLEFIAKGRETTTQEDKWLERAGAWARGNLVYAQLGHKVSIWTQNFANYFNLWDLGKTKYNIKAVQRFGVPFTRQQREEMEWVHEQSSEMRHRFNNFEREFRKEFVTLRKARDPNTRAKEHAFALMVFTDRLTAYPAWIGAYEQTLDGQTPIVGTGRFLPGGDKNVARMYADRRVRLTLTAAGPKDLSRIMRGSEWFKAYTIYMTWFSGVANRVAATKWDVKEALQNKRRAEAFNIAAARVMAIAILPGIASELYSGRGPEDDEKWYWWALRKAIFYPLSSMPFVRDLARGAEAAITGESTYGRGTTTPVGVLLEKVGKAGHELAGAGVDALSDEFDLDEKALAKAANGAAGLIFGFPSSQNEITMGYWYDVFISGAEDPEGVIEFIQKSMFRRPPPNKRKDQGGFSK